MSNPKPGTGPGKGALPHQDTVADTGARTRHAQSRTPFRLAFYGRTNQCGRAAQTELAIQLGLCRAVLGHQAVITRTHYDFPELAATLPVFTSIDAGGLPHAGGWDELAAAMDAGPGRRDFEAVICTTADRISRRLPVLQAREEFARRCGTPILCADELTTPEQYRSIARQLRRSPFSTPAPGAPAHRLQASPCPCPCNSSGSCGGCGHAGCAPPPGKRRPAMMHPWPHTRRTRSTRPRTTIRAQMNAIKGAEPGDKC